MILKPGDKVDDGRYQVVKEFDRQGNMSRMYVVRNVRSGVEHLLKVNLSHEELVANKVSEKVYELSKEDHIERTKREFEITKDLRHPNITQYSDFIPINNRQGLLTSPINECVTLDEMIDNLNSYDTSKKRRMDIIHYLLPQMTSFLIHLNSKTVEHQDIKPENILIDKEFNMFVMDFGIAVQYLIIPEALPELYKRGGAEIGKPDPTGSVLYRPPKVEIYFDKGYDVWSMGIICLEVLFGEHPFVKDKKNPKQKNDFSNFLKVVPYEKLTELINQKLESIAKELKLDYRILDHAFGAPGIDNKELILDIKTIGRMLNPDSKKRVEIVSPLYHLDRFEWASQAFYSKLIE